MTGRKKYKRSQGAATRQKPSLRIRRDVQLSLTPAEAHQCDIVGLLRAGRELLNRLQDVLTEGRRRDTARCQDGAAKRRVAESLPLGIRRVGDAVGVDDDRITRLENDQRALKALN